MRVLRRMVVLVALLMTMLMTAARARSRSCSNTRPAAAAAGHRGQQAGQHGGLGRKLVQRVLGLKTRITQHKQPRSRSATVSRSNTAGRQGITQINKSELTSQSPSLAAVEYLPIQPAAA